MKTDEYKVFLDLRNALAAAMRVLVHHDLVDEFLDEVHILGIPDGVGVRADEILKR